MTLSKVGKVTKKAPRRKARAQKTYSKQQLHWMWKAKQVVLLMENVREYQKKAVAIEREITNARTEAYRDLYGDDYLQRMLYQRPPRKIMQEFGPAYKLMGKRLV